MAILKCSMCGGTIVYDEEKKVARCPYCESTSTIFEQDIKLFEQFQDMFRTLLAQQESKEKQEGFWIEGKEETLTRDDGENITINYLMKQKVDICTMYVAKKHVIYVFAGEYEKYVRRYKEMVEELKYPDPLMEKELKNYIPEIVNEYRLEDGSFFVAVSKEENVYPLKLFGMLVDRHVAWMVSRLENLCCLLDYNGLVLNALIEDNIFVNPETHQLYLYGGWWFAGYVGSESVGSSKAVLPYMYKNNGVYRNMVQTDLESLRMLAIRLLGYSKKEELKENSILPEAFARFLLQEPKSNAVEDFALWDCTLKEAYGARKFIPLNFSEEEIYGRTIKNVEE